MTAEAPSTYSVAKWAGWAVAMFLLVVLIAERVKGPADDWVWLGTLGEWVSGIGAFFAVSVALLTWRRQAMLESARHAEQVALLKADLGLAQTLAANQADDQLRQAVRGVWGIATPNSYRATTPGNWEIEVHNETLEPIFHVLVNYEDSGANPETWQYVAEMIAPGALRRVTGENLRIQERVSSQTTPITINFVDAAGNIWWRTQDGRLFPWQNWPIPGIDDPTFRVPEGWNPL